MRSAVVILVLLTAACATAPPASPSAGTVLGLPEIVPAPGPNVGCAGSAPLVVVRIDPSAEPAAWFELAGARLDVLWPPGYRVVTDPRVVIDPRGEIVFRDDEEREVELCATQRDGVVNFSGAP